MRALTRVIPLLSRLAVPRPYTRPLSVLSPQAQCVPMPARHTYTDMLSPPTDKLHDFSDLPMPHCLIAHSINAQSLEDRLDRWQYLAEEFPEHPAVAFHYGETLVALLDYDGALRVWDTVLKYPATRTEYFKDLYARVEHHVQQERKRVAQVEAADAVQTEGVFHKWSPIKPIPADLTSWKPSLDIDITAWNKVKNNPEVLERFLRLWSIETGQVENLYSFSEGVTKSLIHLGFLPALMEHQDQDTSRTVSFLLEEQKKVVELIMDRVDHKKDAITPEFLCELQSRFVKFARFNTITPINRPYLKVSCITVSCIPSFS
eukprot:Phypoly_transcript_04691.p1 GENE.Phypoly_transcript_04691~~Phypoly_transcript_04691.p1  ORF type:complete len:318 (+),score=11.45 Phypoly_transcript_04691:236-1189(+)